MNNLPIRYQDAINKVLAIAKELHGGVPYDHVVKNLTFELNTRLRTTAGKCYYKNIHRHGLVGSFHIVFASIVMDKDTDQEFYNTVSHEIAHAFAGVYGSMGHDSRWERIHKSFGGDGERCHKRTHVVKNVRTRIILEREGKEYRVTKQFWEKNKVNVAANGYQYKGLMMIDNGMVSRQTIHA
jgi:predicted SprT family Zn-dependent metalloprotease